MILKLTSLNSGLAGTKIKVGCFPFWLCFALVCITHAMSHVCMYCCVVHVRLDFMVRGSFTCHEAGGRERPFILSSCQAASTMFEYVLT